MDPKPVEWRPCEVATVGCSPLTSWALISTEERDRDEMIKWYYELRTRLCGIQKEMAGLRYAIVAHVVAGDIENALAKGERLKSFFAEETELYRVRAKVAKELGWGVTVVGS